VFTPVRDLLGAAELDELRAEAARLSSSDILELAREALGDIAADGPAD
jgi:hypothetical protein